MKAKRGEFAGINPAVIAEYNLAEVRALELVMKQLHAALRHSDVDLKLARWDGAGAVAAAIFEKFKIKDHLQDTAVIAPSVHEWAKYAFAGGRIESGEVGIHRRGVNHDDIRSAYPNAMRHLPSLNPEQGRWVEWNYGEPLPEGFTAEPPQGFTLVRVVFDFPKGLKYYPFFWRAQNGSIAFPAMGEGIYWYPEYAVAREFEAHYKCDGLSVYGWKHWQSNSDLKPFAEFVEPMYRRRMELKKIKTDPTLKGPQIVLKLGLNSLYGKLVQQLGAEIDDEGNLIKRPPYFQIEYAGYITSFTRAKLFHDYIPYLDNVISFATDAAFSKVPVPHDEGEELGQWEGQTHECMAAIQSGVYTLFDDKEIESYTRGFAKHPDKTVARQELLEEIQAWSRGETTYALPARMHMITLKEALRSQELWAYRGCFRLKPRVLRLDGGNPKRQPIDVGKTKPHLDMVTTKVTATRGGMSRIYKLGWKSAEREDLDTVKLLKEDDYG
jgi:hypothetical protein